MRETANMLDNERIILLLQKGDHEAFETVYRLYSASLRAYASVLLHDDEAAYEVVQDIFVTLWKRRQSLDPTQSLKNYLLRATHNNSLHWLQLETNRHIHEQVAMLELTISSASEEISSRIRMLTSAISELPPQSRRVLEMSYWKEKDNASIAKELSISVRTVETILYKVRKTLRRKIGKR